MGSKDITRLGVLALTDYSLIVLILHVSQRSKLDGQLFS